MFGVFYNIYPFIVITFISVRPTPSVASIILRTPTHLVGQSCIIFVSIGFGVRFAIFTIMRACAMCPTIFGIVALPAVGSIVIVVIVSIFVSIVVITVGFHVAHLQLQVFY